MMTLAELIRSLESQIRQAQKDRDWDAKTPSARRPYWRKLARRAANPLSSRGRLRDRVLPGPRRGRREAQGIHTQIGRGPEGPG